MNLEVITNNAPRLLVDGYELSDDEKKEFDYIADIEGNTFFRYKGQVYDFNEFMRVPPESPLNGWDGYISDSYFSGIVIKLTEDNDYIIVGRYLS